MGNKVIKFWTRIQEVPKRSDITMVELDRFMINSGFKKRRQNSSHRIYSIGEDVITIACHSNKEKVKSAYLRKVAELIRKYGIYNENPKQEEENAEI